MKPIQYIFLAFILLFLFSACSRKPNNDVKYRQLLIGDWSPLSTIDRNGHALMALLPPTGFLENGYAFYDNDTVEVKEGFWKIVHVDTGNYRRQRLYFGSLTQYKVNNDTLSIYNPSDSTWQNRIIVKMNEDSLYLKLHRNDNATERFIKKNYNLDTTSTFEKIIVTTSGCFGSCERTKTIISSDGMVIFYGGSYATKEGYYTSRIPVNEFKIYADHFRKAGIKNLKTNYDAEVSDQQTVITTFIKDGKIYKSIIDYGRNAPIELIGAYTEVCFLYRTLQLHKLTETENPAYLYDAFGLHIETKDSVCSLNPSESFLLWDYLRSASQIKSTFKKLYEFDCFSSTDDENDMGRVETDGELYKFIFKKKEPITLDIGFNFIEMNRTQFKFTKKTADYYKATSLYERMLSHPLVVTSPKLK